MPNYYFPLIGENWLVGTLRLFMRDESILLGQSIKQNIIGTQRMLKYYY